MLMGVRIVFEAILLLAPQLYFYDNLCCNNQQACANFVSV